MCGRVATATTDGIPDAAGSACTDELINRPVKLKVMAYCMGHGMATQTCECWNAGGGRNL